MRLLTIVIPPDTNANPFKNNSSYPVFQARHESEANLSFGKTTSWNNSDVSPCYHNSFLDSFESKPISRQLFLLFEVHITLGFKSDVSTFIYSFAI